MVEIFTKLLIILFLVAMLILVLTGRKRPAEDARGDAAPGRGRRDVRNREATRASEQN